MTSELARPHVATEGEASVAAIRVPEERIITMMTTCAEQVARVSNVQDAKKVVTMAEAVAAITRKADVAREIKKSAVRILVSAEAKLGEICRTMPRGGRPGKIAKLESEGLRKRRVSLAERLSQVPQQDVDRVIDEGANTLHGVTSKLGLLTNTYELRTRRAEAFAFLAEEAVGLLERCVKRSQVPHAGTVAEMSGRLRNIKAHGNLKER